MSAARAARYRERKRNELGDDVYRAEQARKRQERRERAAGSLPEQKEVRDDGTLSHPLRKKLQKVIDLLTAQMNLPSRELPKLASEVPRIPKLAMKLKDAASCDDLLKMLFLLKNRNLKAQNKKAMKMTSVRQHFNRVQHLFRQLTGKPGTDCSSFEFLRDTDAVLEFIDEKWSNLNTRNTYQQSISSLLSGLDGFQKEYKIYSRTSTALRKEIQAEDDKNEVKEGETFVHWKQIKSILPTVGNARDKAAIGLLTLMPPRRGELVYLKLGRPSEEPSKVSNWLWMAARPPSITYDRYKTFKSYGRKTFVLPVVLVKIFKDYIKEYKLKSGDLVFPTRKGTVQKNPSQYVTKLFARYSGLGIGIDVLRHSFITDFLSKKRSVAERKKMANKMGHSVSTQAQYLRLLKGNGINNKFSKKIVPNTILTKLNMTSVDDVRALRTLLDKMVLDASTPVPEAKEAGEQSTESKVSVKKKKKRKANSAPSPWIAFVKKYRESHPDLTYQQALKAAGPEYKASKAKPQAEAKTTE